MDNQGIFSRTMTYAGAILGGGMLLMWFASSNLPTPSGKKGDNAAHSELSPSSSGSAEPHFAPPPPEPGANITIGNGGTMIVPVSPDSHFRVPVTINGQTIVMLVDSGATTVSIGRGQAESMGIQVTDDSFTASATTASGVVRVAPVRVPQMQIGNITLSDVDVSVVDTNLPEALLGQSVLQRLSRVEFLGNELRLMR